MSVTEQEWQEYHEYLAELTNDELKIELDWLESVGQAKKRGSVVTCIENNTIQ